MVPVAAAPAKEADPLVVHLDTVSPELPRTGDVEITGTVTNVSDDTFTRVNLHAFSSQAPILDAVNLAASAAVDPSIYVGERVTVPGTFDTIDVLAPGESADVRRLRAGGAAGDVRRAGRLLDRHPRSRRHRRRCPRDGGRGRPRPHVHPDAPDRWPHAGGVGHPPDPRPRVVRRGRLGSAAPSAGRAGSRRAAASTACSTWPSRPARRRTPGSSTPRCCSRSPASPSGNVPRTPWTPTPRCPARSRHRPANRPRRPPTARRSPTPSRR